MLQYEIERQGLRLFRWRSYLPIFFLALAVLAIALRPSPIPRWWQAVALAVGLAGLLIRILTAGYTPKNTSGRNTSEGQVADTINTTGMYSLVRHPLYLGNFLMWLAPCLLSMQPWFILLFIALYWLYYERIMFAEEQFLAGKFGDAYRGWAANVPPFIPVKLGFRTPALSFSWKKVLRQEKNGLFALFLVMYVMVWFNNGMFYGDWFPHPGMWFWATVVTGVIYFVLKAIKYQTSWLKEEGR